MFFFYDFDEQPWGFDPKDKNGFSVVYSTTTLSSNALRHQPDGLNDGSLFKGFTLLPKIELTAPGWNDAAIESLHLSETESDAYSELFHPEGIIHRMGGYAGMRFKVPWHWKPNWLQTASIVEILMGAAKREREEGLGRALLIGDFSCRLTLRKMLECSGAIWAGFTSRSVSRISKI